jgi:hypothetical protein
VFEGTDIGYRDGLGNGNMAGSATYISMPCSGVLRIAPTTMKAIQRQKRQAKLCTNRLI